MTETLGDQALWWILMCQPLRLLIVVQDINNRTVNIHCEPPYHGIKAMSG